MLQELENSLAECRDLLKTHDVDFWADKIDALLCSRLSPYYFASKVIEWYGGIGSFNDVLICVENGYRVERSETEAVNTQLRLLQDRIHELARRVQRGSD